jgi:hypothetical protein
MCRAGKVQCILIKLPKCGLSDVTHHLPSLFAFRVTNHYFKENCFSEISEHVVRISGKVMDIPVSE